MLEDPVAGFSPVIMGDMCRHRFFVMDSSGGGHGRQSDARFEVNHPDTIHETFPNILYYGVIDYMHFLLFSMANLKKKMALFI